MTRLCRGVMPADCIDRLGVVGCYIYMLSGGAGDGTALGGLGPAAGACHGARAGAGAGRGANAAEVFGACSPRC